MDIVLDSLGKPWWIPKRTWSPLTFSWVFVRPRQRLDIFAARTGEVYQVVVKKGQPTVTTCWNFVQPALPAKFEVWTGRDSLMHPVFIGSRKRSMFWVQWILWVQYGSLKSRWTHTQIGLHQGFNMMIWCLFFNFNVPTLPQDLTHLYNPCMLYIQWHAYIIPTVQFLDSPWTSPPPRQNEVPLAWTQRRSRAFATSNPWRCDLSLGLKGWVTRCPLQGASQQGRGDINSWFDRLWAKILPLPKIGFLYVFMPLFIWRHLHLRRRNSPSEP